MNRKIFFSIITVGIIVGGIIVNVNLATNNSSKLSEIALANVEALASNENRGGSGDGWTEEEKNGTHKIDGTPVWQRVEVNCYEGGPMSSCEESCNVRYYVNGSWSDWKDC